MDEWLAVGLLEATTAKAAAVYILIELDFRLKGSG